MFLSCCNFEHLWKQLQNYIYFIMYNFFLFFFAKSGLSESKYHFLKWPMANPLKKKFFFKVWEKT